MALIWIVTTGNTDVKLTSNYMWGDLRGKNGKQLKPCNNNQFCEPIKEAPDLFSLPARVMGIIYSHSWDLCTGQKIGARLAKLTRKGFHRKLPHNSLKPYESD